MTLLETCEHCARLRAIVEAASERLGRPVDSYDAEAYAIPFHELPRIADVQECACRCHAHLSIVGRWKAPT